LKNEYVIEESILKQSFFKMDSFIYRKIPDFELYKLYFKQ